MEDIERICAELKQLGVASVRAEYSGYGDSGQLDEIVALNEAGETFEVDIDKPLGEEIALRVKDRLLNREHEVLSSRIEQLVFDTVDSHGFSGFENNEGGQGTLFIDVAEGTATLVHTNNPEDYGDENEDEEAEDEVPK